MIKSKILFSSACSPEAWKSLLGLVCVLAKKKPWLRQECGWILYSSIGNLSAKLASILIQELSTHELIRTPEGVAIWLEVRSLFPGAVSHTDVSEKSRSWKHGDPLHHKASSSLADIMKDAKLKQTDPESQAESQGTGMWSAQLHFAWDVVLRELYQESYPLTEGKDKTRRISFKSFWLQVVDGESKPTFQTLANTFQKAYSHCPVAQSASNGDSFSSLKCCWMLQSTYSTISSRPTLSSL